MAASSPTRQRRSPSQRAAATSFASRLTHSPRWRPVRRRLPSNLSGTRAATGSLIVYAVGKPGDGCGFYVNGAPVPVAVCPYQLKKAPARLRRAHLPLSNSRTVFASAPSRARPRFFPGGGPRTLLFSQAGKKISFSSLRPGGSLPGKSPRHTSMNMQNVGPPVPHAQKRPKS